MTEKVEAIEKAEGKAELAEKTAIAERINRSLEIARAEKELGANEAYENIARGLTRWVSGRIEDIGSIAELAAAKLGETKAGETEIGRQIIGGLEKVAELTEKGAEFLRREEVEAIVELAALAFLLVARPELAFEYLRRNPGVIGKSLEALG